MPDTTIQYAEVKRKQSNAEQQEQHAIGKAVCVQAFKLQYCSIKIIDVIIVINSSVYTHSEWV
jgi:hypothetical protein